MNKYLFKREAPLTLDILQNDIVAAGIAVEYMNWVSPDRIELFTELDLNETQAQIIVHMIDNHIATQ